MAWNIEDFTPNGGFESVATAIRSDGSHSDRKLYPIAPSSRGFMPLRRHFSSLTAWRDGTTLAIALYTSAPEASLGRATNAGEFMYEAEYKSKLCSAEQAVQLIPKSGTLSMGMGVSEPPGVLAALEQRILRHEIENLRLYYSHSVAAAFTILKYEYMDVIKPHPFFPVAAERELARQGALEGRKVVYYMPGNFSRMPRVLADIGMDAFIVMVAPMDKGGFFSCGTNGDYTIPTAQNAKQLIVEVNPRMPRVFGDSAVHISDVEAIVENTSQLAQLPARPSTAEDLAISKLIVEMVPDRATLQIGVGGVPNAICAALTSHKDLGIHTELMTPPLVALIQSGAVSNRYKNINKFKNVYTLALGDDAMYEFLNDNSGMELYPVDYVNDPEVIGRNDNVISINAFLQVGLDGEVNSEVAGGAPVQRPRRAIGLRPRRAALARRQVDPHRALDRGARNHLAHRAEDRGTRD